MESYENHYERRKKQEKEINLKEIYYVIKSRVWLVIIITILAAICGYFYSKANYTPLYQASARIIIGAPEDSRNTLQVIIKDSTVLDKVVSQLHLKQTPESLAEKIAVSSIDDSQVVSISVTDVNPEMAANIANTTARVFKEEIPKVMNFEDVRLLSDAKVNPWPINQNGNRLTIISGVLGLVIGVGLIFLLDSLDDSLRRDSEVEELLELPVLGRVSKINDKNLKKKYVKQLHFEPRGESIGLK